MVNTESTVELKSFKTHFWNSEVGNYSGFSDLVKHCNQGRILSKEYIEFLRQRSQIEDQYGKALQKLAKTSCGGEELVGGRKLWESLKNHTETVGLAHSQASLQLENELVNLAEYLEEGREKKRWSEENVRSLQAQLKTAYKRQQELRKVYEARCREEVQTSHAYHQEVARGGLESGAAEKAAARHSKVRSSMESAETAYRGSVDYVEEVRELWEKETELAADILQDLEQRRLSVLRDSVWKLSNILSATCVADDEVYEETRVVLEQLDLKECIQLFINQHQTGTSKPGCLQPETLPNSSTIGMGHARQYESCSLGRSKLFSSLGHLSDSGRSRSDLGFSMNQPPVRPRKPPRLHTYEPPTSTSTIVVNKNNVVNNNNKITSLSPKPSPTKQTPPKAIPNHWPQPGPTTDSFGTPKTPLGPKKFSGPPPLTTGGNRAIGNRRAHSRERHTMPICVENSEYFRLPGVGQQTGGQPRPPPVAGGQPRIPQGPGPLPVKPFSDYIDTASLATRSFSVDPKPSYSSDYSDTSLDSGKFSASTPPTPLQRYFPPTSPAPAPRYRSASAQRYVDLQPAPRGLAPLGQASSALLRRARVLCEYKQNRSNEISLSKNEMVWVVEGGEGGSGEWWRVQTEIGRVGFFPANFLRVVDSPT